MIKIELLSETNFCLESLDSYNRKQNVNKVYRRIDGEYALVECKYTEDCEIVVGCTTRDQNFFVQKWWDAIKSSPVQRQKQPTIRSENGLRIITNSV